MTRRRVPWVFRLAAGLLLTTLLVGQWWQRQSAGAITGWVVAMAAVHCPAAAVHRSGTIADSARTLDGWGYAVLGDAILRDGRARCLNAARGMAGTGRSPEEQ